MNNPYLQELAASKGQKQELVPEQASTGNPYLDELNKSKPKTKAKPAPMQGELGGFAPVNPFANTIEQGGKPVSPSEITGTQKKTVIAAAGMAGVPLAGQIAMGGTKLEAKPKKAMNLLPPPDRQPSMATRPVVTQGNSVGVSAKVGGQNVPLTPAQRIDLIPGLTPGQRAASKLGSGDLGTMAEGVWNLVAGAAQQKGDEYQTTANEASKIIAGGIKQKFPNGIFLKPEIEAQMRKTTDGKIWAETIKNLDPSQLPAFVEQVTRGADKSGNTGLKQAGAGMLDIFRRIGEGDEDAAAQLMGMWNAFTLSAATGAAVKGALPKTPSLPDVQARMNPAQLAESTRTIAKVPEAPKPATFTPKEAPDYQSPGSLAESGIKPKVEKGPPPKPTTETLKASDKGASSFKGPPHSVPASKTLYHGSPHKFNELEDQSLFFTAERPGETLNYSSSGGAGAKATDSYFVKYGDGDADIVYDRQADGTLKAIAEMGEDGDLLPLTGNHPNLTMDDVDLIQTRRQGAAFSKEAFRYEAEGKGNLLNMAEGEGWKSSFNRATIREVIGSLDSEGNELVAKIIREAKDHGTFSWNTTTGLHGTLKGTAIHGVQTKAWEIIKRQLKAKGYDGIRFPDDGNVVTTALFEKPRLTKRTELRTRASEDLSPKPVQTPEPPKVQKFAASNAASTDLRKAVDLPELKKTPKVDDGVIPDYDTQLAKARKIVSDVERGQKAPVATTEDVKAFARAEAAGNKKYNDLTARINQGGDTSALVRLREDVRSEIDAITQASRYVGTEQSRAFSARNKAIYEDFSPAGLYNDWRATQGGKALAPEYKVKADAMGTKIGDLERRLEVAEKLSAKLQAEASVRQMAKQGGSKAPKGSIEAIKARRTKAVENISAKWKASKPTEIMSDPFGAQTAYNLAKRIGEIAPDIRELAKTFLEESALRLDDLTAKIRTTLKASGVEIEDGDIHRALSGEYERPKKFKSELVSKKTDRTRSALKGAERAAKQTEASQAGRLARLRDKWTERAAKGDFKTREELPELPGLERLRIELEAEKVKAADVREELKAKYDAENRNGYEKMLAYGGELINAPRTLVASTDMSALMNQGAFVTSSNPIMSLRSLKRSLGALTETRAAEAIAKIKLHPKYNQARAAGLDLFTTTNAHPNELLASKLLSRLPNVKLSERQMTAFLNDLRMEKFSQMVETSERPWFRVLGKQQNLTLSELRQIAEYVNTVTGAGTGTVAGNLKALNKATGALFAPGFMVSRWKTAFGTPAFNAIIRKNPKLAANILKDYVKVAGVMYGTLQILKAQGLDVETDVRSSDFGKIRLGGVKIDPFGGLLAPIRVAAQLSPLGSVDKNGKHNKPDAARTLGYYGTGKFSPAYSTMRGLAEGEKFGEKFNLNTDEGLKNVAWSFAPISIHTNADLWSDPTLDVKQKALLSIGSVFGVNINKNQRSTYRN